MDVPTEQSIDQGNDDVTTDSSHLKAIMSVMTDHFCIEMVFFEVVDTFTYVL